VIKTDVVEVTGFSDSTASDAWRPTGGKVSKEIDGKVNSIACTVTWKDQGWGNQKGSVKIALMRKETEVASEVLFTHRAPHAVETNERTLTTEDIITKAKMGDVYALYHIVGGGGGHSITIDKFSVTIEIEKIQKGQIK
jgi:hypothetical protein